MEGIKIIGTSICITLVATTIFSMLVPNSKLDKVLRFAISLFFLTSLISPFTTAKLDFSIDLSDIESERGQYQLQAEVDKQFSALAQKNLENSLGRILQTNGINVEKVVVLINKSDIDNISITKLTVYTDGGDNQKINEIIKKEVGIMPKIIDVKEQKMAVNLVEGNG